MKTKTIKKLRKRAEKAMLRCDHSFNAGDSHEDACHKCGALRHRTLRTLRMPDSAALGDRCAA